MSRYRELLRLAGARRVLIAGVLGRLPLGMTPLALLLLVESATGSFGSAGLAVGAYALAGALSAPLLGTFVDRWGQWLVLVPSALTQSGLLVALVLAGHRGAGATVLVAASALAGALVPPIAACVRVLWADLVADPLVRETAYALDATTQEVIWTTGPLLVAGMVGLLSPSAAMLLSAALTAVGTLWFASAPLSRGWRAAKRPSQGARMASRGMWILLAAAFSIGIYLGGVEVGLPAIAVDAGAPQAAGIAMSVWSSSSLLGGLLYGSRRWGPATRARLAALLLTLGTLTAPLIAAGSLTASMILAAAAGVALAPSLACLYTLTGAVAPAGRSAEAFTWNISALITGIAAGTALAGLLVETAGSGAAFALAALGPTAGAAVAMTRASSGLKASPAFGGASESSGRQD